MKTRKLIDRVAVWLELETVEQRRQATVIEEVLEKLKHKEHDIRHRLAEEHNELKRQGLAQKIERIHAPRKMALTAYRAMGKKSK